MHVAFISPANRQRQRALTVGMTVLLIWWLWLQSGCQMFASEKQFSPLQQAHFMDAWKTYLHCRASDKPDDIRFDVYQLKELANKLSATNQAPGVLPSRIRSLFAPLPSRLAVEPREMVVACALHGGQVAESAGRLDLSRELFNSVVPDYKTAESAPTAREPAPLLD
jgi:hypothetical protein